MRTEQIALYNDVLRHYHASAEGELWKDGDLVTPELSPDGYLYILHDYNGATFAVYLHRLILYAYKGPPEHWTKNNACHRNDVRTDNRLDNLYWATQAENTQDYRSNKTNADYLRQRQRLDALQGRWRPTTLTEDRLGRRPPRLGKRWQPAK